MDSYPAPLYPMFKRPMSIEEIMPKVRELVSEPAGPHFHSLRPGYGIKKGDKILFVALSEYDPMVVEAMCRAMRELGAHVDLFTIDSTPVAPPQELAAHEALAIDKDEDDFNYWYTLITNQLRTTTAKAIVQTEKYSMVIGGFAGPLPFGLTFPWHRFNFVALEDFASPIVNYPSVLQRLVDEKAWAMLKSCQTMRLTDPEGTDVTYTNYEDERSMVPMHLHGKPANIGHGFGGKDDCNGVISGTLNHMGAFPYCRAYLEGSRVTKVEGGGYYGDVWREMLERYEKVQWPLFPLEFEGTPKYQVPGPGFFWFCELAIGTIPSSFRLGREGRFECYANFLHDRMRGGYVHCGFGTNYRGIPQSIKAGLPWTHLHIHLIFATLEGKTAKGERVTVIDKGHLTALDDPAVRKLASKYGNPDKMLKEIWWPALPGINAPGDYMNDYAQDPVSWIIKEAKEHPTWID